MTLIEDSFDEMVSEYGREFTHYKHLGTTDDFWNDDSGFENEGTTFLGQVVGETTESEMADPGFIGTGSFTIRTRYGDVEDDDKIEIDGEPYRVVNLMRNEIQGRTLGYTIEVESANI